MSRVHAGSALLEQVRSAGEKQDINERLLYFKGKLRGSHKDKRPAPAVPSQKGSRGR